MRYFHSLAFVLVLFALPVSAVAQDSGVLDMTGIGIYAMEETVMQAAQETVSKSRRGQARIAPAPTGKLTYSPSIERRRINFARFIAKARETDPEGAATLEKQLGAPDLLEKMGSELAALGMRTDNVGDAYAVWWLNAWLASRQRADTPPARQIAAVRAQAAQAMNSVTEIASGSDAVKQETAETLLIQTLLMGAYIEHAKADPALFRQVADAARKGARASGLDLDAMELTDDGFVPSRVGAVADKPAQEVALAHENKPQVAAAREDGGDQMVVYAAIAAAVGGLSGGFWLTRGRKPRIDPRG
jgi:hypothetical protein